jgi:micrococcal nuclease
MLACTFSAAITPEPIPVPPGAGPVQPDGLEPASVANVVDGDTIELADGRRVRYIGINTPERDQPYYQEATTTNRQLVGGQQVQLEFDQDTFDQYGRSLAYVWVGGQMANLALVQQGYANAFTVPPNVKYEAEFVAAEREARQAERGLWAGAGVALEIVDIQADAPGSDQDNPNGEWVEVANRGGTPVQMAGYTLKDEANHIYTFGNFTLQPGQAFKLYSGQGQDSDRELYWGLVGDSVWNNGSDTAFLRDAEGALVDSFAY